MSTPNKSDVGNPLGGFPVGLDDPSACDTDQPIPTEDLLALAAVASEHTVDGQTVKERTIDELIKVDQYITSRRRQCASGGNAWGSIGVAKGIPPDAAGRC